MNEEFFINLPKNIGEMTYEELWTYIASAPIMRNKKKIDELESQLNTAKNRLLYVEGERNKFDKLIGPLSNFIEVNPDTSALEVFVPEGSISLIGLCSQITEDRQEAIKSTIDAKNNIEAIKKNIERLRGNNGF